MISHLSSGPAENVSLEERIEDEMQGVELRGLGLPPDTGRNNPILQRVDGERASYLFYHPLKPYITGEQKNAYLYPLVSDPWSAGYIPAADFVQRVIGPEAWKMEHNLNTHARVLEERCPEFVYSGGNQPQFMDRLTRMFRAMSWAPGKQYSLDAELGDRRGFLKHSYMIAVRGDDARGKARVLGGVWEDGFVRVPGCEGLRVMSIHAVVAPAERRNSLGREMVEVYEKVRGPRYDGLQFLCDDDPWHEGADRFFECMGYAVSRPKQLPPLIQAVKLFGTQEQSEKP